MRTIIWRRVSAAERRLEAYEVAYLAGGPQRVVESALFALRDRGDVTILGRRVRAVEEDDRVGEHPVERAILAKCPEGRSLGVVANKIRGGREVAAIKRELVALGLVTRGRHRLTPAGRRQLEAAKEEATFAAYIFDGPSAHADRRLRRVVANTAAPPGGLGRSLIRMGRAADSDSDNSWYPETGGFGCGSGGGGGGGGGND